MTLEELKQLVELGESNTLEFKKSTANLKGVAQTLCAFLNGEGGTVLIGVNDSQKILGQKVTDQTQLDIAQVLRKFEPTANVDVSFVDFHDNDHKVIVMTTHVDKSSMPYVYDGRAYERCGSSTSQMSQTRYQQMLLDKIQKYHAWELMEAINFTFDDLDHEEIIRAINDSIHKGRMDSKLATEDPKEALRRLKLLNNGNITNASIVLFCRDPMPYYPQCLLRMVRFEGVDKSRIRDSRRIYGHAFLLLDEAEKFLKHHMSIRSEFIPGKMARNDIPDYAPRAIREAMINAICHRSYTMQGGSISLAIYEDRLEITSPGKLINGIHLEDLKRPHDSHSRNSTITNVMYRRGFIEAVGIGTQEIVDETKSIGKPEPEYLERGETFVVVFRSKTISQADLRQFKILELLQKQGELQKSELAERLPYDINERTLRRDLQRLEELGVIETIGKGRNLSWRLKAKQDSGH